MSRPRDLRRGGDVTSLSWDDDNNRIATIDARDNETTRVFDDQGNVLSETDTLGNTRTFAYDPFSNEIAEITDARGHSVVQTYDARGNLITRSRVVQGVELIESFTYDEHGQLIEMTDENDEVWSFDWDSTKGVLQSTTNPLGETNLSTTDPLGRITGVEDAAGNTFDVAWDDGEQITSFTDPFGVETILTYDDAGRRAEIDNDGRITRSVYDAAGRIVQVTDPLGSRVTLAYDELGHLTSRTDALGRTSRFDYDEQDRLLATIDAAGGRTEYTYDKRGRLSGTATSRRNAPNGVESAIEYDPAGRGVLAPCSRPSASSPPRPRERSIPVLAAPVQDRTASPRDG